MAVRYLEAIRHISGHFGFVSIRRCRLYNTIIIRCTIFICDGHIIPRVTPSIPCIQRYRGSIITLALLQLHIHRSRSDSILIVRVIPDLLDSYTSFRARVCERNCIPRAPNRHLCTRSFLFGSAVYTHLRRPHVVVHYFGDCIRLADRQRHFLRFIAAVCSLLQRHALRIVFIRRIRYRERKRIRQQRIRQRPAVECRRTLGDRQLGCTQRIRHSEAILIILVFRNGAAVRVAIQAIRPNRVPVSLELYHIVSNQSSVAILRQIIPRTGPIIARAQLELLPGNRCRIILAHILVQLYRHRTRTQSVLVILVLPFLLNFNRGQSMVIVKINMLIVSLQSNRSIISIEILISVDLLLQIISVDCRILFILAIWCKRFFVQFITLTLVLFISFIIFYIIPNNILVLNLKLSIHMPLLLVFCLRIVRSVPRYANTFIITIPIDFIRYNIIG